MSSSLLLILCLSLLLVFALKMGGFAPWLPTRRRDIDRLTRILDLQKDDICYELGSGDGRVAIALADQSQAKIVAIEVFPLLHMIALFRRYFHHGNTPHCILGDLFRADLQNATHIYLFGMPESLQGRLTERLRSTLRPGTIVVSYIYPFPDFRLIREDRGDDGKMNPFWVYRVAGTNATQKQSNISEQ